MTKAPSIGRASCALVAFALLLAPSAARADEFTTKVNRSNWSFEWGGYLNVAWRWIMSPDNYNLVGRNNGFQLENARLGANLQYKDYLAARLSFEGASEDRVNQSFPGGTMTVRLRDAYVTFGPYRFLRLTVGQQHTPWDLDSMRSSAELPFVSRSLAVEGVQANEGVATHGLGQDRNLGISLHSGDLPFARAATFRYSLFVGNGNGQNQLLNSNNLPSVFGRVEFAWWGGRGLPANHIGPMSSGLDGDRRPVVMVGLAGEFNPRTAGNPPDLVRETNRGFAADVAVFFSGVNIQGGVLYVNTAHDTLPSTPDLERLGWWAHVRYTLPRIPFEVTPGYRISGLQPRAHLFTKADPADPAADGDLALLYHTIGLTIRPVAAFPARLLLNYTITQEKGTNVLANDRFEAGLVAAF